MRRNVVVLIVFALATAGVVVTTVRVRDEHRRQSREPNIVVIMTDDQTLESMRVLPNVARLIASQGTTFTQYAVSFPNCCPSRATYMTGQYAHNTGVLDNVAPYGGAAKLRSAETLEVWLQRAGYDTASVGKYLNSWGADGDISPPPGWDRWYGLIDPSTYHYFDYDVSVDGTRRHFGHGPDDYSTDVLATEAVRYIDQRAGKRAPFFLSFTPLAPHDQAPEVENGQAVTFSWPVPAPKYKGTMADQHAPRTPSWFQADVSRLPKDVRRDPQNAGDADFIDGHYQAELEALRSVDDAVGRIMGALAAKGVLDRTVVLFTSDNGFFHGEHRLRAGKFYLYEPAVHLPLYIRGGPFTPGSTVDQPASNVDLAPTILALAGAKAKGLVTDGRNLVPMVGDPAVGADRGVLLENFRGGRANSTWGIRTREWKYLTDRQGEEELYHLTVDPDEVDNLAGDPSVATVQAGLAARAKALARCAGASCEGSDAARAAAGG